ncbi:hypothetical protein KKG72_11525 [bacterium]|nr:hypothetical protein [bacterium]MBU1994714.1 hypothetical protein [bacterium]
MKSFLFAVATIIILSGCSTKEFNEGVESITSDVSEAFENSRDKSESNEANK